MKRESILAKYGYSNFYFNPPNINEWAIQQINQFDKDNRPYATAFFMGVVNFNANIIADIYESFTPKKLPTDIKCPHCDAAIDIHTDILDADINCKTCFTVSKLKIKSEYVLEKV